MIYEWYSGSDVSLAVPRQITELYDRWEEVPHRKRVSVLDELLQRERDSNWRGYLMYLVGRAWSEQGDDDIAVGWFEKAKDAFDPLYGSFRDVGDEYCRTMLSLIESSYESEGSDEVLVDLGFRALQALRYADFHESEEIILFRYLGGLLNRLGHVANRTWCYAGALTFYLSAHHLDPDEPGCLESLMYTYFNVDQLDKAKEAYELFLRVADTYTYRERVVTFFRERIEPKLPRTTNSQ